LCDSPQAPCVTADNMLFRMQMEIGLRTCGDATCVCVCVCVSLSVWVVCGLRTEIEKGRICGVHAAGPLTPRHKGTVYWR